MGSTRDQIGLSHTLQTPHAETRRFLFQRLLRRILPYVLCDFHAEEVGAAHRVSAFGEAPIFAEKLRRGETAGQGIARRKVMGSAVSLTTMTDSLHSHNSNPRKNASPHAALGVGARKMASPH